MSNNTLPGSAKAALAGAGWFLGIAFSLSMLPFPAKAAELPHAEMWLNAARVHMERKAWDEARDTLEKITVADTPLPVQTAAWNLLANLHARQGRLEEAQQALDRALALDPGYDVAWENLGDVHLGLAAQAYAKAARTRNAGPLHEKSVLLREMLSPGTDAASIRQAGQASLSDAAAVEAELLAATEAWRAAWQARDVERYLSFYAPDFHPQGGSAVPVWRAERTRRLTAVETLSVVLEKMKLDRQRDPTRIKASFIEHLSAGDFQRARHKTLEWKKSKEGWRILRETAK